MLGILFPVFTQRSEESFLPLPGKERTWVIYHRASGARSGLLFYKATMWRLKGRSLTPPSPCYRVTFFDQATSLCFLRVFFLNWPPCLAASFFLAIVSAAFFCRRETSGSWSAGSNTANISISLRCCVFRSR